MAKKADTSRGTIEVEFIADAASLATAMEEGTQGNAGGSNVARAAKGPEKNLKATTDVALSATSKTKLNKDVQAAINGDTDTTVKLQIDTVDLRSQIEKFLTQTFKIKLDPQMEGVSQGAWHPQGTEAERAHSPLAAEGTRGPVPDDLKKIERTYKDSIENLYSQLAESMPNFKGTTGTSPFDKLAAVMQHFNVSKFEDLLSVDKSGKGFPRAIGGALAPQNLEKQGIDPATAKSLESAARSFTGLRGDKYSDSGAQQLFVRMSKWMEHAPAGEAAPMVATAAVVAAQPQAAKASIGEQIRTQVEADEKTLADAKKAVIEERQSRLTMSPIGPALPPEPAVAVGPGRTRGGRRGTVDDEAESRAQTQLGGGERANPRRLRGEGPVIAGIATEPYLRRAEMGQFQNAFEQFVGKQSKGVVQMSADREDVAGQEELSRLARMKPGVRRPVAGKEGTFAPLSPNDAMIRTILSEQSLEGDPNAFETFRTGTEKNADVRKAMAKGASPSLGTSGETKRGQGGTSQSNIGNADPRARLAQFDRNIEVAETRVSDLTGHLDSINVALERASKNRDTGKVQELEESARKVAKQLQRVDSGLADAMKDRAELLETAMPSDVQRPSHGEHAVMSAISQGHIASGGGLTEAEKKLKALQDPEAQGKRGRGLLSLISEQGHEVTPKIITDALEQRYLANPSRVDEATGQSLTSKQALRRAAYGPTGKARRSFNEGEDAGVYGEIMAPAAEGLSKDARSALGRSVDELMRSAIEDVSEKMAIAEEAIAAKEGARTRGPLPGKTTASAIADTGINPETGLPNQPQRVAFDRPGTGEGMFLGPGPGQAGTVASLMARNRRIKAGDEAAPPPNSEFPYVDPEGNDLSDYAGGVSSTPDERRRAAEARVTAMVAEREKADKTRQKTLGRGRTLTGDQTTDIARAAGVPMAEEPDGEKRAPLAGFYEKYAGGAGSGAGGGGTRGGGGAWSVGGGGPISVYVIGGHLDSVGASGGGGGRGRGRVTEEGAPEEPMAAAAGEPKEPKGKRRKNINARDIGTAADTGKVYTFEPDEDPRQEAKSARQRELIFSQRDQAERKAETKMIAAERAAATKADAPDKAKAGIIGLPSRDRVTEEARRSGIEYNFNDPRGVSGLLTSAPSNAVLEANSARQRAQRSLPQRAISTSVVQIAENAFGGLAGPQQRLAILANRTQDVNRLAETQTRLREGRRATLAERRQLLAGATEIESRGGDASQTRARAAGLGVEFQRLIKTSQSTNEALKVGAKEVKELAASAVTGSDVLRNLAAGAVGGVAGGLAAGAIAQASQAVIQVATQALGPVFERLSGFGQTTGRVQGSIAQDTIARGGDIKAAVAAATAAARLTDQQAAIVKPELTERSKIVAGQQSLAQGFDLFNASRNIGKEGADRALTRTTGGLFDAELPFKAFGVQNISLGGQASIAETLDNQLSNLTSPADIRGEQKVFGANVEVKPRNPEDQSRTDKLLDDNNKQLGYLNAGLKNFKLISNTDQAALDKQSLLFAQARAPDVGGKLAAKGISVEGVNTADDVTSFLKEFSQGPELSAQQILDQTQRQREANLERNSAKLQFGLDVTNPQSQAIALGQQGFGAGGPTGTEGVSGAADRRETNAGLTSTRDLYKQVNEQAQQGMDAAATFVTQELGAPAGADFAKSLKAAADYGQQISDIQIGLQVKQAAYQSEQFSYQIGIAKRNLADAKGLVSGIGDSLGAIERQMYNLQRESQSLSLGQSQRQINFQTATAGFNAGGLTGEERAARIKQAKIEAEYAQKQLDIQKKLFGLQGQSFDKSANRNVSDLQGQLGLLEKGRAISLDTTAAEKRIKALTILQERENKKVESYYAAAVQHANDIIDLVFDLRAATGEALNDVTKKVLKTLSTYYTGLIDVIQGAQDAYKGDRRGSSESRDKPLATYATGVVGDTSGETSITVGEAGTETVAVLRQPRKVTGLGGFGGGAGGGGSVTIIVQGNKFNTQEEQDELVRKLTYEVNQAQARNLALTGLRN